MQMRDGHLADLDKLQQKDADIAGTIGMGAKPTANRYLCSFLMVYCLDAHKRFSV